MDKLIIDSKVEKILWELEEIKFNDFIYTISLADKAFEICRDAGYDTGMSAALLRKGQALSNLSRYDEAIPTLFNSLKLSQENNICDLQIAAHISIGNILSELEEYEKSFDSYMLAHKLAAKIDQSINYFENSSFEMCSAKTCTNIAEVYKILGDHENALKYSREAQRMDKLVNYNATMGISLSNLGEMDYIFGNYDTAEKLILESLKTMKYHKFYIVISDTYRILASIYEKKGDYKNANKYFIKAINVDGNNSQKYYKIDSFIAYSKFLIDRKDLNGALEKLHKALEVCKSNKILSKGMNICKIISQIYKELGDTNKAYNYYDLYFSFEHEHNKIVEKQRADTLRIKTKLQQLESEKFNIIKKNEKFKERAEKLDQTITNISLITDLGQKITSTQDLDKILEILGTSIKNIMNSDGFALALYDEDKKILNFNYWKEKNIPVNMADVHLESKSSIAAYCVRNNEFIVINNMEVEYSKYIEGSIYLYANKSYLWTDSAIYSPLVIDNVIIGIMILQSAGTNAFNEFSIEIMKALSSYASIAVNNAIKSMNLTSEINKRKKTQYELEKLNNKLLYLSENDSLTGIPNRRKFDNVINYAWEKAKSSKTKLSLIILDVDYFKEFNDNYGHLEGDKCLALISKELFISLSQDDIVARFGGDEFVILLPKTNIEDTIIFGNKLIKRIKNLSIIHNYSKISNTVTITMGATSVIPNDSITITQFMNCADDALYAAKIKGRNQIFSTEMASNF
jgi:diguanylate cyclase (GGDEF)-like protein